MHTPFMQLIKLHSEILVVGVGEARIEELEGETVTGTLDVSEGAPVSEEIGEEGEGKEEGSSTNSELEIGKMNSEEVATEVMVRVGEGIRISQNSPV